MILLLFGCRKAQSPDWGSLPAEQRQAVLDRIADECRLHRSAMKFTPPDQTLFQPSPNADYNSVDCALGKLKDLRGFGKMGFIGNEAYVEENKN